ncbi:hypothetical protein [Notoacmeibacter ruber]|uniref:Uncharacterized protein n=1 Tax=Notoacmeibacter ruber TaxID=2670375 RepID=A0A3L7JA41_9HYPH|nr:hypothetical protein [Notoacmeibacter ruber]RLQ87360.1 hypothetical protein D8780_03185 [Notoacmeibacter ruber]
MDKDFHVGRLIELLNQDWGRTSIVAHNRISDIRILLSTLNGEFTRLDNAAAEAETIVGTAIGMGDERLTDEDVKSLSLILQDMKERILQITDLEV